MVRMRSPVQVWSAAPLKNTPLRVCFFNAFLTHLRDLFPNRAWSLSSAIGDREYFVLSSPSLAVSSSITTNEFRSRIFHFIFNEMKCTACSRAERSSPADGVSSCKQSPRFSLSSKLSRQTSRRYGVPFLCASRTPLQKLCRRVRRRRSRLPLASNFSLFSCRQQLYGLFYHRSLSAAVLFVWFFNLKISWFFF